MTISGVTIKNNRGNWEGGVISNTSILNLKNSTITRNGANDGGAIHNEGPLTIEDSTLTENS